MKLVLGSVRRYCLFFSFSVDKIKVDVSDEKKKYTMKVKLKKTRSLCTITHFFYWFLHQQIRL